MPFFNGVIEILFPLSRGSRTGRFLGTAFVQVGFRFPGNEGKADFRTLAPQAILGLSNFGYFRHYHREVIMLEFLKKTLWIGAGLAAMTAEKIEETVKEIVKRGDITEKEGKELVDDLIEKSKKAKKDFSERVESAIQEALQRLKVPSRGEVDELKTRIEKLEKALEKKE